MRLVLKQRCVLGRRLQGNEEPLEIWVVVLVWLVDEDDVRLRDRDLCLCFGGFAFLYAFAVGRLSTPRTGRLFLMYVNGLKIHCSLTASRYC
jgi:hypothetical protein